MLKPIETVYNGYRFRSRLEARWAVFFDRLGIAYQYEIEGFDLGEAGWYLPDFYLTKYRIYVEIKPATNLITDGDKLKINAMGEMIKSLWQDTLDEELHTIPTCLIVLVETPDVPWQDGDGSYSVKRLLNRLDLDWKRCSVLVSEAVRVARQTRFEHNEIRETR